MIHPENATETLFNQPTTSVVGERMLATNNQQLGISFNGFVRNAVQLSHDLGSDKRMFAVDSWQLTVDS